MSKTKQVKKTVKFIILTLIAVIQLFPLYWLLTYSLKTNAEILGDNILGFPWNWQWGNYRRIFASGEVIRYFFNSVFFTGVTIVVVGVFTAMAAYAIIRMKWKMNAAILMLFTIGIMIPTHAALLPLFQFLDKMGIKGGYLGLLLPYIAFGIPMSVMILCGFYRSIPKEMEEAAFIDGCGIMQMFFRIILPIIKPALATASIFTFMGTWNELLFATTFLDDDAFRTLPVGIMAFSGVYNTDLGLIGAGLVVATVPTMIIYALFSNKVQESLVAGAVKG